MPLSIFHKEASPNQYPTMSRVNPTVSEAVSGQSLVLHVTSLFTLENMGNSAEKILGVDALSGVRFIEDVADFDFLVVEDLSKSVELVD